MELKTRLDVLIQVAKLAQKNGLLSLDDACVVKHTIDEVENNTNYPLAPSFLMIS